ncbi:hypothetical protein [Pseudoduganella sp. HUAS MS19]
MTIEFRNTCERPLHDLQFRLCFSDSLAGIDSAPPQRLFVTTFHHVDGAALYSATAHADGPARYGRPCRQRRVGAAVAGGSAPISQVSWARMAA